jgi:DNA polymerase-3 subunit beta
VENGRDEIRINSVESKDFPLIPEYTQTYPLELPVRVLSEALKKVLFAVSTNESRIELTGVLLTASDRGIHLVATDSFRLSEVTLPQVDSESYKTLQAFLQTKNGIILPVETLQELSRVIEHEAVSVHMALEDNQVFFEIGGVRIVSRVIQGKYPDYQQILPKEFQSTITLPRGELIRSLKMAASFAQYGSGEVQFVISAEKSTLEIVTTSSGVGQPPSEDKTFIFQPRHLLEGMNAFSSETIILHLNTKDMPVLLTGDNPESQIYLVMPIRK